MACACENQNKEVSEEAPQCPNFEVAQLKFALSLPDYSEDACLKKQLSDLIAENDMAPYYELVCKDLNWELDESFYDEMKTRNEKVLAAFDKDIEASLRDMSLSEIKDLYLKKAKYLSQIGDKENSIRTLSQAYESTVALKNKLDNIYHCIRIGFFFVDTPLIQRQIQKADSMLEEGADWQSRNCFKIYKALYYLVGRDFKTAADLLVNSISTFNCTELISYETFIRYTLLSAVLALSRSEIKKELVQNPDMQQALHDAVTLKEYLFSLYNCDYKLFFLKLADVEVLLKQDMLLNAHYNFYVREMKIKAYDQLLSTYISVNISYMSNQFGVSEDYIENELSKFIAGGRLNYKIDKISGKIVNERRDSKMEVFRSVMKHGDIVLNRIQKLSRVINI